jgi:hypothetical protein
MAIKQDVNAPLIVTIGVVSGLLLLVVVFGLQAWFVREERAEITEKWESSPNTYAQDLRAAQRARIHREGPVEEAGAKVTMLPIDKAIQITIQRNGMLPSTQPSQPKK